MKIVLVVGDSKGKEGSKLWFLPFLHLLRSLKHFREEADFPEAEGRAWTFQEKEITFHCNSWYLGMWKHRAGVVKGSGVRLWRRTCSSE